MLRGKRLFFSIAAALAVIVIMFFAANRTNDEVKLVYFIAKASDSSFWKTAFEGAETAAREYNVELVVRAPLVDNNYIAQNRFIEEAINNNAGAIVFAACDYDRSVEYAEKAVNAGLNFVVIDSDINSKKKTAFIGTDNLEAGAKAAQTIVELRGPNAKIGIVSCEKEGGVSILRVKSFTDYIGTVPDAEISDIVYAESNIESPYELTKAMFETHPEINAVFTVSEWATIGATRAVGELGLGSAVTMVSFDNNIESIKMLEAGVIDTLVVQNPFAMGYLGVQTAIEAKKSAEPTYFNTRTTIINRSNMYDMDNQKLLFPLSYEAGITTQ